MRRHFSFAILIPVFWALGCVKIEPFVPAMAFAPDAQIDAVFGYQADQLDPRDMPDTDPDGICAAGQCPPLAYPLPDSGDWQPVTSAPVIVPVGCGTAELPCNPSDPTFPWLPDTGQTSCYDATRSFACPGAAGGADCESTDFCGQDAQYGYDVTQPAWDDGRLQVSGTAGEEIVTDNRTGLVWQKEYATGLTWATALSYCRAQAMAGYAGRNDWRLPDRFELLSLLNYATENPVLAFWEMPAGSAFLSSSSVVSEPGMVWTVDFSLGSSGSSDGSKEYYAARCVASGLSTFPAPRYYQDDSVPGESVVFDTRTGLLWQRAFPNGAPYGTWQKALQECEQSNYAGREDWRLPNVFELVSIVDLTRTNPATDPGAFAGQTSWFWSSTTSLQDSGLAFDVKFEDGQVGCSAKNEPNNVRCVALGP